MKKSNREILFRMGLVLTAAMLLVILIGIFWTPYDPNAMNGAEKLAPPSFRHLFGTDKLGRDIFSRVVQGAGATFLIAAGTVAIGLVVGGTIGALTGYFGGWFDELLMRANDVVLAFPSVLLCLVLIALMGTGTYKILIALGIVFIPSFARVTRTQVARQKSMDYVQSARLQGASDLRILFVHIMPNTFPVMLSSVAIGFNNAVLAEASMSFLGVGVQPPDPSLGSMLSEAQGFLTSAPWYALSVGITIVLMNLGFGLLSEGLEGE